MNEKYICPCCELELEAWTKECPRCHLTGMNEIFPDQASRLKWERDVLIPHKKAWEEEQRQKKEREKKISEKKSPGKRERTAPHKSSRKDPGKKTQDKPKSGAVSPSGVAVNSGIPRVQQEEPWPRLILGSSHALILTKDGRLYGVGKGDTGALGETGRQWQNAPRPVVHHVISAAASPHYTIYVTEEGRVKLLGNGLFVKSFQGFECAQQVAADVYADNFWIKTASGKWFGFGDNQCNTIAKHTEKCIYTPVETEPPPDDEFLESANYFASDLYYYLDKKTHKLYLNSYDITGGVPKSRKEITDGIWRMSIIRGEDRFSMGFMILLSMQDGRILYGDADTFRETMSLDSLETFRPFAWA